MTIFILFISLCVNSGMHGLHNGLTHYKVVGPISTGIHMS